MLRNTGALLLVVIALFCGVGCQQIRHWSEQRQLEATRIAEEYPYVVYSISEESKTKICMALTLPPEDELCQADREVMAWEVVKRVKEVFPVGQTAYSEVEAKLGSFPHIREAPTREDGTLIGLRYIYGLTEFKGACLSFYINLDDLTTVDRINATSPGRSGSGWNATTCGPFE